MGNFFWLIVLAVAIVAALAILVLWQQRIAEPVATPGAPEGPVTAPAPGKAAGAETPAEAIAGPVPGAAAETAAPEAAPAAAAETPAEPVAATPPAPVSEAPEAPAGRMVRLRRRLASSKNGLARALADLLAADHLDAATWESFETTLLTADLGIGPTTQLVDSLRAKLGVEGITDPAQARQVLHDDLVGLLEPGLDRSLNLEHAPGQPAVVMVVGVNGTGKTTTVGKLARLLVAENKTVLLGAADTFRAAAAEQLTTWGTRVGVATVSGAEGADPASVAYQAVERGISEDTDVVLVDTAGRLHTKVGLMDELGKVKRVIEKKAPVSEVLLVIDATTGQNGLAQARVFAEAVAVTGLVLTKLDGSAKGGIVVAVQRELGVPVKLVGLGEGMDDLAPFDAEQFVKGLLGE